MPLLVLLIKPLLFLVCDEHRGKPCRPAAPESCAPCRRACRRHVCVPLSAGSRRGELTALRWADVDLEQGVLTIGRSIGQIAGDTWERRTPRPTSVGDHGAQFGRCGRRGVRSGFSAEASR